MKVNISILRREKETKIKVKVVNKDGKIIAEKTGKNDIELNV